MPASDNSRKILRVTLKASIRERTYQFQREELAPRVREIVRAHSSAQRSTLSIADLGCGNGHWLRNFAAWNRAGLHLCGVDLDARRIRAARLSAPCASFIQADCRATPFAAESFDIVTQFTLFSSLTAPGIRQSAAKEILRVLKPGGVMIWYDFFAPNPLNRQTRPVGSAEIRKLFPDCAIRLERTTLLPPLARLLCRCGASLPRGIRWLRTHYLAVIEKPCARS